jgi:hypothetical protein
MAKREFVESLDFKGIFSDKPSMAVGIALGIVLVLMSSHIKPMLTIICFIALGAASLLYSRFIRISLGFELIMLFTVLAGFLYGTGAALFTGLTSMLFAFILSGHFSQGSFVSFIGIIVVCFLIPVFKGTGITGAGILLTLIYDAIIASGYIALGSRIERTVLFVATHVPFNIWAFIAIAPRIYDFLA